MDKVLNDIEFLVGDKFDNAQSLLNQKSHEIFSNDVIDFLSEISNVLFKSVEIRDFPDVATFAFYCRKANLNLLQKKYLNQYKLRFGRGIIFHITPGNVPVNFAYSLLAGLITGNINIVRTPSKDFRQVSLIVNALNNVLKIEKFRTAFSNRLFLIKYNRESEATNYLSSFCDVRIIWGGNESINYIRRSPILPKSTEITFSDRYSISIIKASSYIESLEKNKIASNFYNDTYLFDQNACTSPQSIYWLGTLENVKVAQIEFWKHLKIELENKNYDLQPIQVIDKLTTLFLQAFEYDDVSLSKQNNNDIFRIQNETIKKNIDLYKCSSGYFNEAVITTLDDINCIIGRKYQTIGYYGFSKQELQNWVYKAKLTGIDRIVPIGRTMNFSLEWDGYDLVSSLSRIIEIE